MESTIFSILGMIISILALYFTIYKLWKFDSKLMLIEENRQKEEKEALLTIDHIDLGEKDILRITNKGRCIAKNTEVFLDGQPFNQHPVAPEGEESPKVIGKMSHVDMLIAPYFGNPIPSYWKITWEDEMNKENYNEGNL